MGKSIKFTIFLIILFFVLLAGQIVADSYAGALPFLGTLAKAFIWGCVIVGIVAMAFVIVIFIKTIKGDKTQNDKE